MDGYRQFTLPACSPQSSGVLAREAEVAPQDVDT